VLELTCGVGSTARWDYWYETSAPHRPSWLPKRRAHCISCKVGKSVLLFGYPTLLRHWSITLDQLACCLSQLCHDFLYLYIFILLYNLHHYRVLSKGVVGGCHDYSREFNFIVKNPNYIFTIRRMMLLWKVIIKLTRIVHLLMVDRTKKKG
jgi:hypothetical protein